MDFFLSPGDNVAVAHVIIQIKLYLKRLNVDSTFSMEISACYCICICLFLHFHYLNYAQILSQSQSWIKQPF